MANKEMKTLTFGDVTYEVMDEKARQELNTKGKPNGIAELDETGKVPEEQLPELGVQLGETEDKAYRGDRGKIAYEHAQLKGKAFISGLYKITTNKEGHITSATSVTKEDITKLGIPESDTTYSDATHEQSGLMSHTDKKKLDGVVVLDSAASHNAIFRGADLTNKYTVDQICERISSGTFEDLYIGDYFDITFTNPSGSEEQMRCILAAFDYYYHPDGYSGTNQHHALIVPKNCVSGYYAINTDYKNYPSEKGFTKSTMFTTTLPSFVTPLQTALNNHIIQHKNYFVSALNAYGASAAGAGMTGYASSSSNTATYLSLLSEVQVYGTQVWSSSPYNVGCDTGQLPLFAFDKTAKLAGTGGGVQDKGAANRYNYWWLRDLVSADCFARVDGNGGALYTYADDVLISLRPLFLIG